MFHGEEAANDVADIMNVGLTDEQKAEQERLMAEQESKQAELLMKQFEEQKEMEEECKEQEQLATESINNQIDEQKMKVTSLSLLYQALKKYLWCDDFRNDIIVCCCVQNVFDYRFKNVAFTACM